MEDSLKKIYRSKKSTQVKIYTVPKSLGKIQENTIVEGEFYSTLSKEEIFNLALKFHSKGNILEAEKYYKLFIDQGYCDDKIFSNYGSILKDQGKLNEAKILTLKALDLKPDFASYHYNLSNILYELSDLNEAELSTRKAIRLNPTLSSAHYNLGKILRKTARKYIGLYIPLEIDKSRIKEAELAIRTAIKLKPKIPDYHKQLAMLLRDINKLNDAEISIRKAIKLNPNSAIYHNDLGTILRDIGKLKESEISILRAIELKSDFVNALVNLGDTAIFLGKLNEVISLSKYILKLKSVNSGAEFVAMSKIVLSNLIKGNISETFSSINNINIFIDKEGDELSKKGLMDNQALGYCRFISQLYPQLEKFNNINFNQTIPHIGESHCLSFTRQSINISSKIKYIQPVLIAGAKAWHFANNDNNKWKASLNQQIKNYKYSDEVFISFGEIDCRRHEGILPYAMKYNKNINKICESTIENYLDYMEYKLSSVFSSRYYFGVPAPFIAKKKLDKIDLKRIELIEEYNTLLKEKVLLKKCYFFDVYALTKNNEGQNNIIHMCDATHLSPKCLNKLLENYLIKPP